MYVHPEDGNPWEDEGFCNEPMGPRRGVDPEVGVTCPSISPLQAFH